MSPDRIPLEGSRPRSIIETENCRPAPPTHPVQATIVVRRRSAPEAQSHLNAILRGDAPPMSRDEADQSLGADPEDLRKVADFAQAHGLAIIESSVPQRSVKVSGTAADMEAAFGATLQLCRSGGQSYVCYEGPLTVPGSLGGVVEGVLGLNQRPVAKRDEVG